MEIYIHLEWFIAIIGTIGWMLWFRRNIDKAENDPIACLFGLGIPTFFYLLFWILWLIIFK
jgi:hypothetical protein